MAVDPRQLRNCLGHFATGVTVVSCAWDGQPHGATVNAFSAVSLDPPLIMVSLDRRTRASRYLEGKPFAVNVLRDRQNHLASHFGGRRKMDEVDWVWPMNDRPPRLEGTLAYFDCEPWAAYDGGDHRLFLGRVNEFEYYGGDPLVFYRGEFRHLVQPFDDTLWLADSSSVLN